MNTSTTDIMAPLKNAKINIRWEFEFFMIIFTWVTEKMLKKIENSYRRKCFQLFSKLQRKSMKDRFYASIESKILSEKLPHLKFGAGLRLEKLFTDRKKKKHTHITVKPIQFARNLDCSTMKYYRKIFFCFDESIYLNLLLPEHCWKYENTFSLYCQWNADVDDKCYCDDFKRTRQRGFSWHFRKTGGGGNVYTALIIVEIDWISSLSLSLLVTVRRKTFNGPIFSTRKTASCIMYIVTYYLISPAGVN